MAWYNALSNQMISYTDSLGGGFALKCGQIQIYSNACMTKNAAVNLYHLNTEGLALYASNQLIPKSVWFGLKIPNFRKYGNLRFWPGNGSTLQIPVFSEQYKYGPNGIYFNNVTTYPDIFDYFSNFGVQHPSTGNYTLFKISIGDGIWIEYSAEITNDGLGGDLSWGDLTVSGTHTDSVSFSNCWDADKNYDSVSDFFDAVIRTHANWIYFSNTYLSTNYQMAFSADKLTALMQPNRDGTAAHHLGLYFQIAMTLNHKPPYFPIVIGTNVWDSVNLGLTTYTDGSPIPYIENSTEWSNLTTGAYCFYGKNGDYFKTYGLLYNWYAIAGIYDEASYNDVNLRKKLAPAGYHIATSSDVSNIATTIGVTNSTAGGYLKEIGTTHWTSPNTTINNDLQFCALPGGARLEDGQYYAINIAGYWWIYDGNNSNYFYSIGNNMTSLDIGNTFNPNYSPKLLGMSVRLVRDLPLPNNISYLQTTLIGTQNWSIKNLDIATYSDGTSIPQVTDQTQWNSLTTGAWCYYINNTATGAVHGKLYNWYAVMGIWNTPSLSDPLQRKKLAPTGYHIPSDTEWNTLITYLGGESIAGGKMKQEGDTDWIKNASATNSSGFTGLPGGARESTFGSIYSLGTWWSSTSVNSAFANRIMIWNDSATALTQSKLKTSGFSVRLIKD